MLALLPIAFWSLTALARAQLHEPASPRYLYPGAVFVLLLFAYLLERERLRPIALVLLLIAGLGSAASNTRGFTTGASHLEDAAREIKADLAGVEIAGPRVDPGVLAGLEVNPGQPQIKAGLYLEAVNDIGSSPALTEAELLRTDTGLREAADREMAAIYGPGLFAQGGGLPGVRPKVISTAGAKLSATRSCFDVRPERGSPQIALVVPDGGLQITPLRGDSPVEVRLKRFGDAFPNDPVSKVESGFTVQLQIPKDSSSRPWQVDLRTTGPFETCGLKAGLG
jgi:hypothetical protein